VLRHAELCDTATARAVAALVDETEDGRSAPLVAATTLTERDGPELHPALRDRLGALPVEVPPLRTRPEDIDALVTWFTAQHGGADHRWTDAARAALRRHPWPGNTRELRNVVLGVLARHRGDLDVDDLPPSLHEAAWGPLTGLQRLEREAIGDALRAAGGNKAEAAARLGISRSTLYRKLREYRMVGTPGGARGPDRP
jgi:sigma-54 dependent transcriptional regulator, acetoin dehydrogenase operon transcriptional activator AcoR